eukprot:747108-Hanusia_phi.AAC.1
MQSKPTQKSIELAKSAIPADVLVRVKGEAANECERVSGKVAERWEGKGRESREKSRRDEGEGRRDKGEEEKRKRQRRGRGGGGEGEGEGGGGGEERRRRREGGGEEEERKRRRRRRRRRWSDTQRDALNPVRERRGAKDRLRPVCALPAAHLCIRPP